MADESSSSTPVAETTPNTPAAEPTPPAAASAASTWALPAGIEDDIEQGMFEWTRNCFCLGAAIGGLFVCLFVCYT